MIAKQVVVEQDARDDERAGERAATGLVSARDEASAELSVEPQQPLCRLRRLPPALLLRAHPRQLLRQRALGSGLFADGLLLCDVVRGTRRGYRGPPLHLPDARLLSHFRAQVVELRAVDVADRLHLDLLDLRRVHRERPLDSDAERLLAHGEGLAHAGALALDDDSLEDLEAAALTLDHLEVHADGVARLELGQVGSQLSLLE